MPGTGKRFTSVTAYHAIKRHRGLKSWRTLRKRGMAEVLIENLSIVNRYYTALRKLHNARKALDGLCSGTRPCACHYAALYGWNRQVVENELVRVKAMLTADMRENRRRWQAEQHARAVAAAAKLDE